MDFVIFKCKMCGGNLEIGPSMTVFTCSYCGSIMTLPKVVDSRRANLFNRANNYRRNNDFDKAAAAYEAILNEDDADAEAHWGVVLCRYGIEYVEDPQTRQRLPTCHRAQYGSIHADLDYKSALQYADPAARPVYEAEAGAIEVIQKQILEISAKEKPFDVFICYKETSENGSRTKDSVIAQDIYYHLVETGLKVFFARITLEEKLGSAYEPYIFAALNSSRVMVVVGTSPENFNAAWTKNEWCRYLALIKQGAKKVIIPAFRDMDAYELPEEFLHLQALDMSRIGFIQDLTRGIQKVLAESKPKEIIRDTLVTVNASSSDPRPLLKRAFLCLEDGDFAKADALLENVLNLDPENPFAYVGKLMVERQVKVEGDLAGQLKELSQDNNYRKALRFADEKYRKILQEYNERILDGIETERKELIYAKALQIKKESKSEYYFQTAAALFRQIPHYKNAEQLAVECEILAKEEIYTWGLKIKNKGTNEEDFFQAAVIFKKIPLYKDADQLVTECYYLAKAAHKKLIRKRIWTFASASVMIVYAIFIFVVKPAEELAKQNEQATRQAVEATQRQAEVVRLYYEEAQKLLEAGKPREAALAFGKAGSYSNSHAQALRLFISFKRLLSIYQNMIVYILPDGTLAMPGNNINYFVDQAKWDNIVEVSQGDGFTIGLRADGTVLGAGDNTNGQLDVKNWKNIVAISAGDYHTIGLKSDGTVVATGNNSDGQLDVTGWNNITAISAGNKYTVGLKSDGTVVATGNNSAGELDVSGWNNITAISARGSFTVGLVDDGTVVTTGFTWTTPVNGWEDIVAVSTSGFHTVGLRSDGTVMTTGVDGEGKFNVSGWNNIIAISAGGCGTVGMKADGTVLAVGDFSTGACVPYH